jgi:hypothetical protein
MALTSGVEPMLLLVVGQQAGAAISRIDMVVENYRNRGKIRGTGDRGSNKFKAKMQGAKLLHEKAP